jgi:hypothetical protein
MRSDTVENVLYLILAEDVTASDVGRLERDAVVAARVLDEDFCLVTDIRDCKTVSRTATEQVQSTVERLLPFGLSCEIHVVGSETPESVRRVLERQGPKWEVREVAPDAVEGEGSKQSVDLCRC